MMKKFIPMIVLMLGCGLFFPGSVHSGGGSALVPGSDDDEIYILWGGVGYLNKQHQPHIVGLLETNSKTFGLTRRAGCWRDEQKKPGSGNCLPELATEAQQLAQKVSLKGSAYPVVVGDFADVLADKGITVEDQLKKEKSTLVLSLISSLEYFVEEPVTTHEGANLDRQVTKYVGHILLGMTALVSTAKEGNIVLSYPMVVQRRFVETKPICPKGKCRDEVVRREMGHAYSHGVEELLKQVPGAAAKLKPNRKLAADVDMVTLAYAHAKLARELFHVPKVELGESTDLCSKEIINPCGKLKSTEEKRICQTALGLISQGVSEGLAKRGRNVLPPLAWQGWAEGAEDRLEVNVGLLKLDTAGANKELKDHIMVKMSSDNASRLVVAKFVGVVQEDAPTPSNALGIRRFRAFLDVLAKDKEGVNCTDGPKPQTIASIQQAPIIERLETIEKLRADMDPALRRGLWLMAMLNALHQFQEGK